MRDVWEESNPWAKYHWLRNPWTKYQSVEEMRKDAEKIKLQLGSEVALNLAKGWDPLPRQFIPDYKDDAVTMMKMDAEAEFYRKQHEQICSDVEKLKKKWCVKSERSYNECITSRGVHPLNERFSEVQYIKTGLNYHNFYPQPIVQELKFLMTAVVALKENAEGAFKKPREVRERIARTLLHPVDGNLLQLEFMIVGGKGTVYEDGVFVVTIELPEDYPESDPKFVFETRIFHPYVTTPLIWSSWISSVPLPFLRPTPHAWRQRASSFPSSMSTKGAGLVHRID